MRFAPSRSEYSEWQWRWTKDILGRIATATRCVKTARLGVHDLEVTENQRVKWRRRAARTLAVVALAIVGFLVLTATGRYLLRAAWEEGKILARRQPIVRLASDSTVSPDLRAKLALVLAARAYAHDSLGLETGQSFTTYSRLDRDTLVLVLSGAYRDKQIGRAHV